MPIVTEQVNWPSISRALMHRYRELRGWRGDNVSSEGYAAMEQALHDVLRNAEFTGEARVAGLGLRAARVGNQPGARANTGTTPTTRGWLFYVPYNGGLTPVLNAMGSSVLTANPTGCTPPPDPRGGVPEGQTWAPSTYQEEE